MVWQTHSLTDRRTQPFIVKDLPLFQLYLLKGKEYKYKNTTIKYGIEKKRAIKTASTSICSEVRSFMMTDLQIDYTDQAFKFHKFVDEHNNKV